MTQTKRKTAKKNRWLMIVIGFFVFLVLSVIGGYFALLYAGEQMIDMQKLEAIKMDASELYDKHGNPIGKLSRETREYVPITEIPQHVIDAFVAVEDKRFFEHNGIDLIRIAGAILKDIQSGGTVEGGSTITQQLAKNVFLSQEKTFWRKTKEVSIAINLERKFSKQQIMEMYLNKIYLGHGVFGVQAASELYFGKEVQKLDVAEAAMLAAIPKAPSTYSPFAHPDKAKERRDTILRLMAEQGYITLDQKEVAQKEPLPERSGSEEEEGLPKGYQAYVDYVVREAEEEYGISEDMLYRGGWKIYTALDPKMQDAMVDAYDNPKLFPAGGPKRQVEAGMVVVDPKDGGIAAMMGGRDYKRKGFNYAVDTKRQPGSAFKPLAVYGPALDTGDWTPNSLLSNRKQSFDGYQPENWNHRYSDRVRMYDAVNQSLNVPAVWLLNEIGLNKGLEYLKKFDINLDPEDRNLAIALGGLHTGTSPLKMAQAYTAFVNNGTMVKAHAIVKIQDHDGNNVVTAEPNEVQVLSPRAAWEMHTMLMGVVETGTGKAANIGRPVAGKTGTTQSPVGEKLHVDANLDAWFVGYTPEYVGAIWMGFDPEDKDHIMRSGSAVPSKLFGAVFRQGLRGVKEHDFTPPPGVEVPKPQPQMAAPQATAVLAMENQQPKVVINWTGNEGLDLTYDVYRFTDSPDNKERIATGLKETTFVDPLTQPVIYKYIVVPRDAQGNEGPPSNVAEVDMSQLDQMLKDAQQHHEENPPDGTVPADGGLNGQPGEPGTDNGDSDANGDNQGSNQGNQGAPGDSDKPPADIPPVGGSQPPDSGQYQPPATGTPSSEPSAQDQQATRLAHVPHVGRKH